MVKLAIFGSARIDAFMVLPDSDVDSFCGLDTKECVIELSYSTKISMKRVDFLVGGNGANVAMGTKRMGVENMLVAELGQGPLADFAYKELEEEINMAYVTQTDNVAQGFGTVINYQGERTILSYYAPERPPFPSDLEETEWAYLTSVGEQFEQYYEDFLNWHSGKKTKVAFNPGGRQIKKGQEWIKKYLNITELLIVNREEGEGIANMTSTLGKEKELINALVAMGPKMCVITDGREGSFAFDGNKFWRAGILPIDAIERTGAGDASSVGLLAALISQKGMKEALLCALINAASVIGYVGPESGLLKSSDLPTWFERADSSGVEIKEF